MISPEQLAQALDRIHPRDRELLSLSLQRRVPDEALARLYDCASTDVARERARAIERLADVMELQRGEDLGAVLKALLEPDTWSATAATVGEEFAMEAGGTRLTPVPPPDDAEITATGPALTPVPGPTEAPTPPAPAETAPPDEVPVAPAPAEVAPPDETAAPAPEASAPPAPAEAVPQVEAAPPGDAAAVGDTAPPAEVPPPPASAEAAPSEGAGGPTKGAAPAPPAPVEAAPPGETAPAGEAAPADETAPPPQPAPAASAAAAAAASPPGTAGPAIPPSTEPVLDMLAGRERDVPDPPRRAVPLALLGLSVASLVGAAGVVGATQFGETNRVIQAPPADDGDDNTRHFLPEEGGPLAVPFPSDPRTISCYSTAYLPRSTTLYREPGGRKRMKITARTEWGSPRVLGVLKQQGGWLGVQAAELRNGEIAWVRRESARVDCVRWSLHADLSKRTLFVRRDGHTVRKMRVAIGRRENPTPKGRFTVTDKLRVTDRDSVYGCCVLALSGHQTDLPAYWPGGDRLAVHATSDASSIGKPVSLGCLRTPSARARWLIETVPLGSPIFIRA